AQMKRETDGTYEGVGITIAMRNEVLTIVAVREDGPAARNGVLPGDQIIKINEFLADKLGLSEAMQMMRGKPGQKLELTLRRPANNQLVEVEMTREVIQESTVKDIALLEPRYAGDRKVGYIRLTQFSEPTVKEMVNGLNDLEKQGMEALVLDLRNNPGGLLSSAVNTCGEFVPPGTVVLTTEGREAIANTKVYRTSPNKRHSRDYPLAILVNHGSASGAEVVSGALQDLRRAVVIGETTFGKGSVQSIIPVPSGEGTAIRLTTARYYTPSKRTIHENGVFPNIVATLTPTEERDLMKWFRRDMLPPDEKRRINSWHDRQLARAVDALKGALVYAEVYAPAPLPPEQPIEELPAPVETVDSVETSEEPEEPAEEPAPETSEEEPKESN
ncbi:MAG: S41 family peptidase, partial [Verrucomicrobiota bacterium]